MTQWTTKLTTVWQRYQLARFDQRYTYRQFFMVMVAILVGLLGGLTTIALHELINLSSDFFFERLQPLLVNIGMGRYALVALPAIGGVLVGLLAWKLIDPHSPHGVAAVMERVALFGGRLRAKPILTRLGGAIITLGSGGSAGPEDPSVQIGSLMGSSVAERLHLSSEQTRTLVGCGAAAGIASAFNAPLAGAFFAMEIILGQFQGLAFAMIVISAVTSAVTTEMILGRGAAFSVPAYTFVSFQELLLYLILGALAGLIAILYVKTLAGFADHFHNWDIPAPIKAGFGGLMVGVIGLGLPKVMGQGYNPLQSVLNGQQLAVGLLAALVIGKIIATSVTLGSGGMGGVFAPSLFIGAMLGSLFGQVAHQTFPTSTGPAVAYAMVGMAAVLAGTIHSPLTAIMLLFEMTNNFRILLPVTIAVVVSTLVVDVLRQDSVYIGALLRRGIQLDRSHDVDVMQAVHVNEVMDAHPPTVSPDMSLLQLQNVFTDSHHHGLPVTSNGKQLEGVVTVQDLVRAIEHSGQWEQKTVADIATKNPVTAYPDEPMWLALKRMAGRDIGRLPVTSRKDPTRLVGVLRRANVVHAYSLAIRRRTEMQEWSDQFRLARLTGKEPLELKIAPGAFADGCCVQDLPLPEGCLLTAARHHRKFQLLHGGDTLAEGDMIMALATPSAARQLRRLFELPADQAGIAPDGTPEPQPLVLYWQQPITDPVGNSLGNLRALLINNKAVTYLILSYRANLRENLRLIPVEQIDAADAQEIRVAVDAAQVEQLVPFELRRLSPTTADVAGTPDYAGPWLVVQSNDTPQAPDGVSIPLRWKTRVFSQFETYLGRVRGCMLNPSLNTISHILLFQERLIPRWVAIAEPDILKFDEPELIVRLTKDEVNQLPKWQKSDFLDEPRPANSAPAGETGRPPNKTNL